MAGVHVVVVGGGFGGLHLVRALERRLRPGEAEVTVIDRNNYHLFTPLLYQVATGELPPHAVAYPLRDTVVRRAGFHFVNNEVESIDLDGKLVRTADGPLRFDRLVVAPGSVTNDYGIPGVRTHALGMKDLADAQAVRRRILESFEEADATRDPERKRFLLTFVVIGAGPVGVELASSTRDLLDHSLRGSYANVDVDRDVRIVLIDGATSVLPGWDRRVARLASRRLAEQRIEVALEKLVSEIAPGVVRTRDGAEFGGNTIVWAGGVRVSPLVAALDLPKAKDGRIVVERSFRAGRDEVFALGDAASLVEGERPLLQLAQNAVLQAPTAAANVARSIRGQPLLAYRHQEKGDLIALGRTQAAARLVRFGPLTPPRDLVFGGFPAWTVWRVNYLTQLLGVHNRASLLSEWLLSYLTTRMVANTP